jgi:hypothetical protein
MQGREEECLEGDELGQTLVLLEWLSGPAVANLMEAELGKRSRANLNRSPK